MSAAKQQTVSSGGDKKSFNIKVPPSIARRIEQQAMSLAKAPTTLIQSIIVQHFENRGGLNEIELAPQPAILMKL